MLDEEQIKEEDKQEEPEKEIKHKPKKWGCCLCKNQYCFIKGAMKHNKKKHESKAKFRDLQEYKI
jgi:hypothetical protein